MITGIQIGLRVLLAAMVALATLMPEPIRHAHAGGEHPHSHDADGHVHYPADDLPNEADHHGHANSCHSHGDHHALNGHEAELLTASTSHWHYFWFGLNVTLSDPLSGHESNEADHDAVPWIGLASNDTVSLVPPQVSLAEFLSLDATQAFASGPTLCIIRCNAPPQRIAAPLCDTARHERSGVQLI
jgi:hypothetical protein